MNKNNKIELNSDWQFTLHKSSFDYVLDKKINLEQGKYLGAEVPGTIHTDLINNNIIDDPFYSNNENKLDWIANCEWIYKKEFNIDKLADEEYQIVFDGLDTIAEIYLNDSLVGLTKNMFLQYKFNLTKFLMNGRNILRILLKSPIKYSECEENKYSELPVALNSSRVYIRKAQYSYGWDWGPVFATSGIWKDVYIEKKSKIIINDITFNTKSLGKNKAVVEVSPFLSDAPRGKYSLLIEISNSKHSFTKNIKNLKDRNQNTNMVIQDPDLWWPNGEGEPNLYKLSVKLLDENGHLVNEVIKSVGIRIIKLLEKENNKPVFKIKVNGRVVYCKGANWIPADSFLPRISELKYLTLLEAAKNANMNIIRVWGGGIYEIDKFYEICDELGLLVWQDFMFACAAYPEHEKFIKNVKEEVMQNVLRLQHHPSIAIWCGNNENEWIWYQNQKTQYKKMPGYKIYHSIIPTILKKIDPTRPYWPSSPFGNDEDPNSFNSGNTHQWSIWSNWIDYEEVKKDDSLFVTEFGFQGPANKTTFEKCLPAKNRKVQDQIFEFHNKQIEGPERIIKFLAGNLPLSTKWDDFIYLAQLNQGIALKTCLEHWQTNGRTFGSLIWQLNDCWPVTSWSLIDSELMPKLSYHFVKNIFYPQILKFDISKKAKCIVYNKSSKGFRGKLKISVISSTTGKIISEKLTSLIVRANSSFQVEKLPHIKKNVDQIIYIGTIYDLKGKQLHRNYYLDKKWKHITLPSKEIELANVNKKGKEYIKVTSRSFSCFIDLFHKDYTFKERGFFLLPGEEIEVEVERKSKGSINLNKIKSISLNDFLCEN
jgi:beta-mannosidase